MVCERWMERDQALGSGVAPRQQEGIRDVGFFGGVESDVRGAASAPAARDWAECVRSGARQHFLLVGSELDHGPAVVWIPKGGEDLPADTEVGMSHVSLLEGLGQCESKPPKLFSGHGVKILADRRLDLDGRLGAGFIGGM
jgi:hypothetical protein